MKKMCLIGLALFASLANTACGPDLVDRFYAGSGYYGDYGPPGYYGGDIGYRYSVPRNVTGRYFYTGSYTRKDLRGAGYERPGKGCLGWQGSC